MYPKASLSGYLICNGAAVSRTTYADLFSVLGTTYGSGDGSTTFNLPDFRGDFIRGYLSGTSKEVGKRQGEGLPEITGWFATNTGWFNASNSGCFSSNGSGVGPNLCQRQYGKCQDRLYDESVGVVFDLRQFIACDTAQPCVELFN